MLCINLVNNGIYQAPSPNRPPKRRKQVIHAIWNPDRPHAVSTSSADVVGCALHPAKCNRLPDGKCTQSTALSIRTDHHRWSWKTTRHFSEEVMTREVVSNGKPHLQRCPLRPDHPYSQQTHEMLTTGNGAGVRCCQAERICIVSFPVLASLQLLQHNIASFIYYFKQEFNNNV